MSKLLSISLAILSFAFTTAHAQTAVIAPAYVCGLEVNLEETSSFPLPIIAVSRTWRGEGIASCRTLDGALHTFPIAMEIRKNGLAVGRDTVGTMHFLAPSVGIDTMDRLDSTFEIGASVEATVLILKGEAGVGLVLKQSGGMTIAGKLGFAQAIGVKFGFTAQSFATIQHGPEIL